MFHFETVKKFKQIALGYDIHIYTKMQQNGCKKGFFHQFKLNPLFVASFCYKIQAFSENETFGNSFLIPEKLLL